MISIRLQPAGSVSRGEGAAKIERVSVLKEYRKKGVGRLLIEEAERWIQESGFKKVCITSRDEAVGFYEALGYKADYSRQMDTGIFKIIYTEKNIEPIGGDSYVKLQHRAKDTPKGNREGNR